jgi:hypothetical protein
VVKGTFLPFSARKVPFSPPRIRARCGHRTPAEFDDAGLPWHRAAERINFLGRTLGE